MKWMVSQCDAAGRTIPTFLFDETQRMLNIVGGGRWHGVGVCGGVTDTKMTVAAQRQYLFANPTFSLVINQNPGARDGDCTL